MENKVTEDFSNVFHCSDIFYQSKTSSYCLRDLISCQGDIDQIKKWEAVIIIKFKTGEIKTFKGEEALTKRKEYLDYEQRKKT